MVTIAMGEGTLTFLSGNPRPREGARAVMAISGGKPCPGTLLAQVSLKDRQGKTALELVLLRDLPMQWTVRPDSIPTDCHPPVTPLGGGAVRGGTRDKPSPGMQTPG